MSKNYGIPFDTVAVDVNYCLGYDIKTGFITGLFPRTSSKVPLTNLDIDTDVAEKFLKGIFKSTDFRVNHKDKKLISTDREFNNGTILFRIPEIPYTDQNAECKLIFKEGTLSFNLNNSVEYPSDAVLIFLITKYNDPTIIFSKKEMTIIELRKGCSINLDIHDFSVFTTKYFNDYSLEVL